MTPGHRGLHADRIVLDEAASVRRTRPVITWPRQSGKTSIRQALQSTLTHQLPMTDGMRRLADYVVAAADAARERRLRRLAAELGMPLAVVRGRFHSVQQVLEDTGIGDGYGQLTIPQPVQATAPAWQPVTVPTTSTQQQRINLAMAKLSTGLIAALRRELCKPMRSPSR